LIAIWTLILGVEIYFFLSIVYKAEYTYLMCKLKLFFTIGIIMQLACNMQGSSVMDSPTPESNAALSITVPATIAPSLPPSMPSPTTEHIVVFPPVIAAESFEQAKALHEYWPVIRQAAGLWDTAPFGTSNTAWALSPDGRYLAVAGCDAEAGDGSLNSDSTTDCQDTVFGTVAHAYLFILDVQAENIIATLPETGEELTVEQLAFTPDGNKLVYALDSGKVQVWDINSEQIESVISQGGSGSAYFDISPNNKWIVLYEENSNKIWDIAEERLVVEIPNLGPAFFSADGQKLLVADHPFLVVYSTSTWQKLSEQVLMPDGDKNTWEISPDLSLLAVCDTRLPDKPVKIWSVATGEQVQTLEGEWGRCGRLIFSPDSHLLLRFDDHGAGPFIWQVEGWKLVQANANATNFVGSGDLFVDWMEFSQDGTSVLVNTFERLTLYRLPGTSASLPGGTSVPSTSETAAPLTTGSTPMLLANVMSCDIVVHGWLNLHLQPCLPPSRVSAGLNDGLRVLIWLKDTDFMGVIIMIPPDHQDKLEPGTYVLGDSVSDQDTYRITARFDYHDPQLDSIYGYDSYDGGTLTITQTGSYISGSFEFGARDINKRQINVEGTFENIPFSHVNTP
jgi:hypothetical protein